MTGLYNSLERRREALAGGPPLTEDERADHERAQTAILAEIHDAIDRAVLAAYGWDDLADHLVGRPGGTTPSPHKTADQEKAEDELLSRLVALNQERAKEEARGHVRWLRPDYQIPKLGPKVPKPDTAEQAEIDVAVAAAPDSLSWPSDPREQFGAVRTLLDSTPEPMPPEAVARAFTGRLTTKRRDRITEVLAILNDLGIVRSGQNADGQTVVFHPSVMTRHEKVTACGRYLRRRRPARTSRRRTQTGRVSRHSGGQLQIPRQSQPAA